MVKNLLQDVTPKEGKSIRKVPVPNRHIPITKVSTNAPARPKHIVTAEKETSFREKLNRVEEIASSIPSDEVVEAEHTDRTERILNDMNLKYHGDQATPPSSPAGTPTPPQLPSHHKLNMGRVWMVVAVCIVISGFALSLLFAKAVVTVTPKTSGVGLSSTFTAMRDADASHLAFDVMTLKKDDGVTVATKGQEKIETRASGTIVVFNKHSTAPQRLIKNTRFESASGLIYRIDSSVVVPGKKTVNGEVVPGSVEVVIYADEVGEKYNIEPSDFTIPGFKGDPRYANFYARSKSALVGGFAGTRKIIAPDDMQKAKQTLENNLRDALVKEMSTSKPEKYTLFPNAYTIEYALLPQTSVDDGNVKINETATLRSVIFKTQDITKAILASSKVVVEPADDVVIADLENFTFVLKNKATLTLDKDSSISFDLKGDSTATWLFDEATLKTSLAGAPIGRFSDIIKSFPALVTGEAKILPFWKRSFPKNVNSIEVVIVKHE